MKNTILTFVLIFSICLSAQDNKQFYSKDFNWRMDLPTGFSTVSQAENEALRNKGRKMLEETMEAKIENHTTMLLSVKRDDRHHLEANSQPFDEAVDGKFEKTVKVISDVMVETFSRSIPKEHIKSELGTETIGGLSFYVTTITIVLPDKKEMKIAMFNRLFQKKELTVMIIYVDPEIGNQMLELWRKSTFT